jgi:hypothetical protein
MLVLILIGIAVFFLVVAILCWLWNITMPDVFKLQKISFWQAFRLLLIAMILFGGGGLGLSLGK